MHAHSCDMCYLSVCLIVCFLHWLNTLRVHNARVSNSQADLSVAMVTPVSGLACQ